MSERFALSLLQHHPYANTAAALHALDEAAGESADAGSDLLVSPECGLTGYDIAEADAERRAFTRDGETADRIAAIARRHGIALAVGYMEAAGHDRYNAVQLVDRDGIARLHYRKTHLWCTLDRHLFKAGDTLGPIVEIEGWKIGALICYDVEFPETVRSLALDGAEIVLVPTALMQPWDFVATHLVRVRAAENQVFLAYANQVGTERCTVYEGRSVIVAPDGSCLADAPADAPSLLHVVLDRAALATIRTELPYLVDRRPELYR